MDVQALYLEVGGRYEYSAEYEPIVPLLCYHLKTEWTAHEDLL